ncbi:UNVERIFIED_CONTAM: putative ATP-dependent RNA helicase DDX47 [Sesamum radiatum]|uniref:ATP-dependent RNA helicase DDX47 n=1 Tax=Sesamum radiatum TaxID=300843 RepID=A0AAW2RC35_SESRA
MAEEAEEKSFKDLGVNEQLAEACDNLGWKNPTKIQVEAIPMALEGKDIIGLAQTGSGKTGAFAIPILQSLLETPQAFFACVLSPPVNSLFKLPSSSKPWGPALVSSVQW